MKKLTKVFGSMMVVVLLLALFAGAALASGPRDGEGDSVRDLTGSGEFMGRQAARNFVDEDGDGVNDNYLSDPQFVDQDGDGACDLYDGTQAPAESNSYRGSTMANYRYNNIDENMNGIQMGTCSIQ